MLSPQNSMPPVLERISPEIVCSVVDLPAPFAPMSVTISPSSTWKDMPFIACIAP